MSKLPAHLENLSKAQLEGLCVDCGLCCYASVRMAKGSVLVPELRCQHLAVEGDTGKSSCSVYDNRHEVTKGWCLPLAEAIRKGAFPQQCPYVRDLPEYAGCAALSGEAYAMVKPKLRKAITDMGKPPWVSDSRWKQFLET
jgi:uncharacterized cysteine cluster protein YcgN (CxxCxxCC family)